ncbi:hypothetical protein [Streptomyces sp. NPDC090112]|uniref:hypothetical protein n=1 Tax=Streptomyces sp. NPDC090112 TaxID=3365949 RepID=UPI0038234FAD
MPNSRHRRAPFHAWFIWVAAATLTLDGLTSLSPAELFFKALFAAITVATFRETLSWLRHRRSEPDTPAGPQPGSTQEPVPGNEAEAPRL